VQEDRLRQAANRIADLLRESLPPGTELLGPAALFRLRGRQRRRLLLKASLRTEAISAVRGVVERLSAEGALRGLALGVDVDPQ
jgi:primosomal protein N' (replication factor Y) (superfamily II helicase)